MSFHIRVDARGFVINDDKILFNEFVEGEYSNIPGGGVEPGETVKQAVAREILEEYGLSVNVGDLISRLKDINYLPYIHEELMEYIKINRFSPVFIEEPLERVDS